MAANSMHGEKPQLRNLEEHFDQFASWISNRFVKPGKYTLQDISPLSSDANGFAGETFVLSLSQSASDARDRYILKRKPTKHLYFLEHDFDAEARTQLALSVVGTVPVAKVFAYEMDNSVLGSPFYITEFIDGRPTPDVPTYFAESWLSKLESKDQHSVCASGLRALAKLHSLDLKEAGADFLRHAATNEAEHVYNCEVWQRFSQVAWGDEKPRVIVEAQTWLERNMVPSSTLCISWGDARPGNVLYRGADCVALIDWDMVGVAAPEQDLGYWLAMDFQFQLVSEQMGGSVLNGWPGRTEMVEIYESAMRRSIDRDVVSYYRVFAAYKIANMFGRYINMRKDLDAAARGSFLTDKAPPISVLHQEMEAAERGISK